MRSEKGEGRRERGEDRREKGEEKREKEGYASPDIACLSVGNELACCACFLSFSVKQLE